MSPATSWAGRSQLRPAWPWLAGLLIALSLVVAVWVVAFSPVFAVRTIEVAGDDQVTRSEVLAAAEVPDRIPLLRLDVGAVADRVRQLDAVSDVDVARVWPHTLRITVVERRALGVVRTDNGYGVLGSDGVVFRSVPGPLPGLPMLDLPPGASVTDPAAAAAVAVVVALPPQLSRRVETVTANAADRVVVTLRGGATVAWGGADATERKARVLLLLLPRRADRYDVSAPEAPVTVG